MHNEEIRLRTVMESSDLPKLSPNFANGMSLTLVAWKVYQERMTWMMQKFSLKKVFKHFDVDNPLVSIFTWTVMVPVGGTFCGKT
jgi:hypothetical protein